MSEPLIVHAHGYAGVLCSCTEPNPAMASLADEITCPACLGALAKQAWIQHWTSFRPPPEPFVVPSL